jgi:hypothetical protein
MMMMMMIIITTTTTTTTFLLLILLLHHSSASPMFRLRVAQLKYFVDSQHRKWLFSYPRHTEWLKSLPSLLCSETLWLLLEMEGAQPGHEADYSLPHLTEANNYCIYEGTIKTPRPTARTENSKYYSFIPLDATLSFSSVSLWSSAAISHGMFITVHTKYNLQFSNDIPNPASSYVFLFLKIKLQVQTQNFQYVLTFGNKHRLP